MRVRESTKSKWVTLYRIAGNFQGRKLPCNVKTGCIMGVACLKFVEKTFAGDCKMAKFVKIFSFENFPLYGKHNFISIA